VILSPSQNSQDFSYTHTVPRTAKNRRRVGCGVCGVCGRPASAYRLHAAAAPTSRMLPTNPLLPLLVFLSSLLLAGCAKLTASSAALDSDDDVVKMGVSAAAAAMIATVNAAAPAPPQPPAPPASATVTCRQCSRAGCRTWACPLGQFCAGGSGTGQCSASVSPLPASLPKFGCNLQPTPDAPIKVTCPAGYSCCSQSGPFARPVDNLTNYCRDSSYTAGQTCCGSGWPCDKNQRCCSSSTSATSILPRAHGQQQQLGVLLAQHWYIGNDLCVDVAAPPPPPPLPPGQLSAPSWSGPGSCCQDPKYHNLSYTCRSGSCCGTDPPTGINTGINDCIDPETEQCCSGKDDPVVPCPRCGYGCPKQQTCAKEMGSCDTSSTCKRLLTTICGWAQKQSPASCFECVGLNAARFKHECFNKSMPGKGEGDFERFCDRTRNKLQAAAADRPSSVANVSVHGFVEHLEAPLGIATLLPRFSWYRMLSLPPFSSRPMSVLVHSLMGGACGSTLQGNRRRRSQNQPGGL
jgi:hypothetical protein